MNYDITIIGARIKEARKDMKLTQEQLAEKLEVARETIGSWERCITTPEFSTLLTMCRSDIFDCEVGYLLGEHEEKTRVATDICKEIGLSEEAVSSLQELVTFANTLHKKYFRIHDDAKSFYSTAIHFIDFLIIKGESVFNSIDDLTAQLSAMEQLKADKYYDVIITAYKEACQAGRWEPDIFGQSRTAELFYDKFEELLRDIMTDGSFNFSDEIDKADFLCEEDYKKICSRLESVSIDTEVNAVISRHVDVFNVLQKKDNIKYLEFDISQSFLDLVRSYCDERVKRINHIASETNSEKVL